MGRGGAHGSIGASSRAVFSVSLEGGVVSSTNFRLVERGAAELDGAASTGRRSPGSEACKQEAGVVGAWLVLSKAHGTSRAADIGVGCAGAVLAGTDAEIGRDATAPSKQTLAARSLRRTLATIPQKFYSTGCIVSQLVE